MNDPCCGGADEDFWVSLPRRVEQISHAGNAEKLWNLHMELKSTSRSSVNVDKTFWYLVKCEYNQALVAGYTIPSGFLVHSEDGPTV